MYNSVLNDRSIAKFVASMQGKSIVLVGNAVSLFSSAEHGAFIDSHDVVVRFGKGIPKPEHYPYLGKKFDGWFFGPGRSSHYKQLSHVPWKIFTPSQVRVYEKNEVLVANLEMYTGALQVYRDFFMTGTTTDILKLNKKVNGTQSDKSRCSQGMQAVEFFIKHGLPVTLIGFDFFGGSFTYTFDNAQYSHIPSEQPTTSWHCPLISAEYDVNPHAFSLDGLISNEEKYIRSLPGVTVIDMPPVDIEKAEWLAKKLRGENSKLHKEAS